ncbi:MAG: hypothetical protein ACP5I1_19940, partial [Candidatus Hinthialibacter sp.]
MIRGRTVLSIFILLLCPVWGMAQTELFYDDFSGDLTKWKTLGNAGAATVAGGELNLEWGYAPSWFVTADSFNFGTD